ncbi:MAG: glycosyltransferase [Candidatus Cloacimonetes bacterium]|nr:glycosyltransferase [Candidatus Cloacimonadota bacterium]
MIFAVALAALSAYYVTLLLAFWVGLRLQPHGDNTSPHSLSVIVAARNEEQSLPCLLSALAVQNYHDFEIVVADDRSTDGTAALLQAWSEREPRLKVVRVERENPALVGKKGALAAAIAASRGEWLVFTDADCRPGPDWLRLMNAHMLDSVDFLAGYSPLLDPATGRERGMKNLERASIFAVTAGSFGLGWPLTCTARNMAYRRSVYDAVDGYADIGHIRSGDDDLMLQKLGPRLRRMRFVFAPAAAVPALDSAHMRQQSQAEVRRASKWRHYPIGVKLMSLALLLFFLALAASTLLSIFGSFPWWITAAAWAAKTVTEITLLGGFLLRVKRVRLLLWYVPAALLYIPYFVYFGLRGTLGRYRWRGGVSMV